MNTESKIGAAIIVAGVGFALLFPFFSIVGGALAAHGFLYYIFPGPRLRRMAELSPTQREKLRQSSIEASSNSIPWYLAPFTWLLLIAVIVSIIVWFISS